MRTISVSLNQWMFWNVEYPDGEARIEFSDKGSALNYAIEYAESHMPCEVKVLTQNGLVQQTLRFQAHVS
jgi:hypothetical protein